LSVWIESDGAPKAKFNPKREKKNNEHKTIELAYLNCIIDA